MYNPYVNSHDNFYFSLNIGVDKFNQVIKSFAIENGISFYDISGYSTSIKEFNQFKEDIQKEILKGLISV